MIQSKRKRARIIVFEQIEMEQDHSFIKKPKKKKKKDLIQPQYQHRHVIVKEISHTLYSVMKFVHYHRH